jgi:hypothetical protein
LPASLLPVEFLKQQFIEHDISPGKFCFEVTETAAIAKVNSGEKIHAGFAGDGLQVLPG